MLLMFAFLWCKCIDLTRDNTAPTNLKIPACVYPPGTAARKSLRASPETGSPV